MGIFLTNREKEVSMGYISFAFIRRSIAKAYDKNISDLYEVLYTPPFRKYTEEENKYFDEHLSKYLDKFLFHSDCDGCFSIRDVEGIYKELKELKPKFEREDFYKKYNDLLELFSQGKRIDIY